MIDPLSIALIATGVSAGTAGVAWAIAALRERAARHRVLAQMTEEQRLALLEEERRREEVWRQEEERRRQEEHNAWLRRQEEARREQERLERLRGETLAATIARIGSEIEFTARRVKVGRRPIEERAIGVLREEVPFPAQDIDVRPLAHMGELHRALPAEVALEDDQFYARAATGELVIAIDIHEETLFETIYEDVWEERSRTLVVVLDVSPSVFPQYNPWMPPVWRGLTLSMIDKAEQAQATVLLHEFDGGDRGWHTATAKSGFTKLRNHVAEVRQGDSTDIGSAILRVIERLEKETFDQAQIMLVTDGEDHGGIDPAHIRTRLEAARIKLHVVLLGVQHQSLLACADTYQIVENTNEGPIVRSRTTRQ
jgi:uncharacterized protein with von Willebrand factor type A (vWA) domain